MHYLKITFVRIVLSLIGANMTSELVIINTNRDSVPLFITVIFAMILYFGLTLYVNNKR